MLPTIGFGFLICSYLPGIPLSLAIYLYCLVPRIESLTAGGDESYFRFAYFIITPLIIGLLLDGIRHSIAYWGIKKIEILEKYMAWKELPIVRMQLIQHHRFDQDYFRQILELSSTYFHVYEFFINLGMSSLGAAVLTYFGGESAADWFLFIVLAVVTPISFISALAFNYEQRSRIARWFS
jgi:hypothetical protein